MTARSNRRPVLLLLMLALPGLVAANGADAWLERMNRALHELDYEGRFVYLHGQELEAMYLSHTVNDGEERERLLSLTGTHREVIRDNNTVMCIVSKADASQVDRRPSDRRLGPVQPIRPELLLRHYRFELGGTERVAGRQAQTVSIFPRDELRYGYRLLLDSEHALPLATATIGADGGRLSQLLFTDLRVGPEVRERADQRLPGDAAQRREGESHPPADAEMPPHWQFHDLPDGFVQARHRYRRMGLEGHQVEHFIFSDGLATVSVYMEPEATDAAAQPQSFHGMSRLGGVTALSRSLPGYRATVLGEVPVPTLKRILAGIEEAADTP